MSTDQTKEQKTNQLTTVKTIYARAAVLLLALNFCLTGYVVTQLNNSVQAQMEGVEARSASSGKEPSTLSTSPPSDSGSPQAKPETLERAQ